MKPEVNKYLLDVITAIESINEYLERNRDFFKFQENKLLRRGVEREIEIIGEDINRILKVDSTIIIENARDIVNTKNWVIHNYDKVDEVIIWGIVINHLPKLKIEVEKLLKIKKN